MAQIVKANKKQELIDYEKENEKKNKKNSKKVKEIKSNNSDKKEKPEKNGLFTKFMIFCHGVKNEVKKVRWTNKKDMLKYSIATIVFIVFCSLFFYGIDAIFALVQSLAKGA